MLTAYQSNTLTDSIQTFRKNGFKMATNFVGSNKKFIGHLLKIWCLASIYITQHFGHDFTVNVRYFNSVLEKY